MAMVRERAQRRGIALRLDVDPDVGVVGADELKLKQVVLNLLTNAVKFTARRRVGRGRRASVGDEVEVTVQRHRRRHRRGDQERIFEAFQRGGRDARGSPRAPASG